MSLKTTVKVSHISNLSDARYCAGMGVEMLGFRAIPGSDHYLAPEVYQDIRGWISGPIIIAELYGISDAGQIDMVMETYVPDYFELTYQEYRDYGNLLALPCIVSLDDGLKSLTFNAGAAPVQYLLVSENTSCADIGAAGYPVLKKITSLQNLKTCLEEGCFSGIELAGPEAQRPGVTNYDQLGTILEALDAE